MASDLNTFLAGLSVEAERDNSLKSLNAYLTTRTFLQTNEVSAADRSAFETLHPVVSSWNAKTQQQNLNIVRWFDLIQHLPNNALPVVSLSVVLPETPELKAGLTGASQRIPGFPISSSPAPAPASASAPASKSTPSKPAPSSSSSSSTPTTSSSSSSSTPSTQPSAAPTPAPSPSSSTQPSTSAPSSSTQPAASQPANARGGRGKGPAKPPPAPKKPVLAAPKDYKAAFGRLNILVGKVVKAEVHPNADTMYVEQIDLGEEAPRQVVSGLRNFIPLEQFAGMKVICLANLKEAKLRQVSSAAMVLCASNPEHTAVEVLTIDDSVPVGERLIVPGFEDAADEVINPKHKVWELVRDSKLFAVGSDGTVQFESVPLTSKDGHLVKVFKSNPGDLIG